MISISTAKTFAKKHDLEGVVIVSIRNGIICHTSYGADRAKCQQLGRLVDSMADRIGEADLSEFEL